MKSKILFFATAIIISSASIGQDVQKKILEASKDAKTKENAAKADVFIQDRKVLTDSSTLYTSTQQSNKKAAATKCKKKKKSKKVF